MAETSGLNHLGLSVLNWEETARDDSYPRNSITDGSLRLTLWQVDHSAPVNGFDRRANVGLHHLALTVDTETDLNTLAQRISSWPGVVVEFMPELMGHGPRKHMMFREPGGIRVELTWPGQ